jgi:hypothetical protein
VRAWATKKAGRPHGPGDVAGYAKPMLHVRDAARGGHCGDVRGPQAHQFGILSLSGDTERPTAMRAFSLVLVIVQIVAVVSANRRYSPIKGCQVTVDNYHFDLCPLLSQRNNSGPVNLVLHHQTPPTITTIIYNISLNGPLRTSDASSNDEQVSLVVMYCCVQSN